MRRRHGVWFESFAAAQGEEATSRAGVVRIQVTVALVKQRGAWSGRGVVRRCRWWSAERAATERDVEALRRGIGTVFSVAPEARLRRVVPADSSFGSERPTMRARDEVISLAVISSMVA